MTLNSISNRNKQLLKIQNKNCKLKLKMLPNNLRIQIFKQIQAIKLKS